MRGMTIEPVPDPPCVPYTMAHPSPWAFVTHQQVGSELIELTHASEAVLLVAALKFDEQGQEDETSDGAAYYRALADACRCIIGARRAVTAP